MSQALINANDVLRLFSGNRKGIDETSICSVDSFLISERQRIRVVMLENSRSDSRIHNLAARPRFRLTSVIGARIDS